MHFMLQATTVNALELRMNFVDETRKGESSEPDSEESGSAKTETESKTGSPAEGDEENKEAQGE